MRRLALAAVFVIFLCACQATQIELTEDDKAAIAAEVNALVDAEWLASTDPVDFDKMMSLVHDTDQAAFSFNGGVVRSHSAMEDVLGAHFASIRREPATITDSMTVVLGPDAAYVIRSGTFVSIDTAGNSGPLTPFVQTLVWVKRDGVWKVLFGHASHGPPVEETM